MQNITQKKINFFKLSFFIFLFFLTVQSRAQFPFFESFKNSTAPGMKFGGSPTAFLTGGAVAINEFNDTNGSGYLRLTNKGNSQTGIAWSDMYAFPSAYGMTISFEYYTHGGSGADGIAFILFDAIVSSPTPGAFGGALGYAQGLNGGKGFSGGYLGIGIDEYGGFSYNSGLGQLPNGIILRGAGSETIGYPYLISKQTTVSPYFFDIEGNDRLATDDTNPKFRKIEIVLKPRSGGGFFIDVYLTHGNIKSLIIDNYEYTTLAPPNLKFAISSSTGSSNNFHEIRNLNISVDLETLLVPKAYPVSFSGCAGLPATTPTDININNNGEVNTLGTINRETVDLDLDTPGIQTSKTIEGKGTFTYDSTTGKVTFIPIDYAVEGSVTINYTFKDSYGKTSNAEKITYNNSIPGSVNNSCLPSLITEVTSLTKSICNIPNEIVSYEVKITNVGNGVAKAVRFLTPLFSGITFSSAKAIYTAKASGPIGSLSNKLSVSTLLGDFNIPPNETVTILMNCKINSSIAAGTYNIKGRTVYFDPTRTTDLTREVTALTNSFGSTSTTYETGGEVKGVNFDGEISLTDDITIAAKTSDITTTGVTICKGATGLLSATSATGIMPTPVTVFRGRWNSATDPKSEMPGQRMGDVAICEFYSDVFGSYKSISFSVNVSGTYSLEMTGESEYLRAGYIYKGNYVLGTCPEDGTWITADDDYGIMGAKNPVLTAHLEVGTLYTLVSLINTRENADYSTDYTWTLTPPPGGGFFLSPLNLWYTQEVLPLAIMMLRILML